MKICNKCKQGKDESEFHKNPSSKDGLAYSCKVCIKTYGIKYRRDNPEKGKERYAIWHKNNPQKERARHLKRKYNLSTKDYTCLYERQNGKCFICGESRKLHVDHDHKTGRIRGLLCFACNSGLGSFKDMPKLLLKAAVYLEKAGV